MLSVCAGAQPPKIKQKNRASAPVFLKEIFIRVSMRIDCFFMKSARNCLFFVEKRRIMGKKEERRVDNVMAV